MFLLNFSITHFYIFPQFHVPDDTDIQGLIAHFHAHANEPVAAMSFDPSGLLLVTACKLGKWLVIELLSPLVSHTSVSLLSIPNGNKSIPNGNKHSTELQQTDPGTKVTGEFST